VTTTARDVVTSRNLLDSLKKTLPFTQGLVVTTVPRGDLQIAQPSNVSESLLKAYAEGFHTEDCLTWQSILQRKVLRPEDCFGAKDAFAESAYFRDLMQPAGLRYVAVAPLAAPVLPGYPGAVHVARTADQGDFTKAELDALKDFARKFDENLAASRPQPGTVTLGSPRRGAATGGACPKPINIERPPVHLTIINGDLKAQFPKENHEVWNDVDERLRNQMVEFSRRQRTHLNGDVSAADRLHLSDSHGDHWPFRLVTYKKYPALGEGPFTFICLQPDCCEWGVVKPADFQADPELARLIPALKFMQDQFRRGPTLVEISATVKLSPFHFHRRFTELLGMTPKQFMLACQIHEAKTELLAGQKELVDIAKNCGFAHQSHFTSRFKQATGLTPTRWRRMAQQREKAGNN